MDKEVSQMIVELLEQNQFGKNFGPKRIMSELRRHNIVEERIPSWIQIQNKLSYYQWTVFNLNNEITPLQDKVRLSVFNGEEAVDKPFVFVYDVDNTNRLVPIVQWVCIELSNIVEFFVLILLLDVLLHNRYIDLYSYSNHV